MYRLYNPVSVHKRIKMTPQEVILAKIIKHKVFNDIMFYKHYKVGDYIADFVCKDRKIIIDIFYGQYESSEDMEEDNIRLNYFKNNGYKVIRIMDKELELDIESIYRRLVTAFGLNFAKSSAITIGLDNPRYQKILKDIEDDNSQNGY